MEDDKKTSIQVSPELRDRLYKLKFRKTYEQFLEELCDMYECKEEAKEE
jgi:predicted DNA-binding protein